MNWKKLFSTKRFDEKETSSSYPTRSSYEVDFDRVVFSSAFRRLQDKTQVIPLPESDFVHTRLTHSLETSCVGRSLAKIIGAEVIKKYKLKNLSVEDFGAVVGTACLAHDIGNPPFGHSGETAISNYFKQGNGKIFSEEVLPQEWSDLTNFEGNANGFRILTNMHNILKGNIKLTFSTLAAFTKYPCGSYKAGKNTLKKIHKKYGCFYSEKKYFEEVFTSIGITKHSDGFYHRHTLAYVVETADDICYSIMDFEDGIRIGLVEFAEAEEILRGILPDNYFREEKYRIINDNKEKIGYLRSKYISYLIKRTSEIFLDNEKDILEGKFDKSLLSEIDKETSSKLKEIETLSVDKIYNSKQVLMIEVSGFTVVDKLLDLFITALNDFHEFERELRKKNIKSEKLMRLLPRQFLNEDGKADSDLYTRLLQICEFIAGMTDTYAINLYKRLTGLEIDN